MLVLLDVRTEEYRVVPGDKFSMVIKGDTLISETVTAAKTINFTATYCFAREDGTCPGVHMCGFFGNAAELPDEIRNVVHYHALPEDKRRRFLESVKISLEEG